MRYGGLGFDAQSRGGLLASKLLPDWDYRLKGKMRTLCLSCISVMRHPFCKKDDLTQEIGNSDSGSSYARHTRHYYRAAVMYLNFFIKKSR